MSLSNILIESSHWIGYALIGPLFYGVAQYVLGQYKIKWEERKRHKSVSLSSEKNNKINELLTELRVKTDADRAFMTMFHNGDKYINGSEILMATRTNESVSGGTAYDAGFYHRMLISLVPEEMKMVEEAGPTYTFTKDLHDCKFKRMLIGREVEAFSRCAIRKNGDIIGFAGLDYRFEQPKPDNIDDITTYCGQLEQVLSAYAT